MVLIDIEYTWIEGQRENCRHIWNSFIDQFVNSVEEEIYT